MTSYFFACFDQLINIQFKLVISTNLFFTYRTVTEAAELINFTLCPILNQNKFGFDKGWNGDERSHQHNARTPN